MQKLLSHTDSKMTDRYAEYLTDTLKITLDNVFDIDCRQTVGLTKNDNKIFEFKDKIGEGSGFESHPLRQK